MTRVANFILRGCGGIKGGILKMQGGGGGVKLQPWQPEKGSVKSTRAIKVEKQHTPPLSLLPGASGRALQHVLSTLLSSSLPPPFAACSGQLKK